MSKRRSTLEQRADILEALVKGAHRTLHVMCASGMEHTGLRENLAQLESLGLICHERQQNHDWWDVTQAGLEAFVLYDELRQRMTAAEKPPIDETIRLQNRFEVEVKQLS